MSGGAFFHRDLASTFSPAGVDGWLDGDLAELQPHIARAFRSTGRVPLVVLEDVLADSRANDLAVDLASARFVPHHHTAYPLHIAPRAIQSGALARFMDWLARPATARLHLGVVGLPVDRRLTKIQVQVSRMIAGERFPPHVDTNEPALACIYNLTRDLGEGDGGALCFIGNNELHDRVVAPRFNTLAMFVSTGVRHEVAQVMKAGALRHSVTAFYVWAQP